MSRGALHPMDPRLDELERRIAEAAQAAAEALAELRAATRDRDELEPEYSILSAVRFDVADVETKFWKAIRPLPDRLQPKAGARTP